MDNATIQKLVDQLQAKLERQKAAIQLTEAQLENYRKQIK